LKAFRGLLSIYQQSYPQKNWMADKTPENQALTRHFASSLEQFDTNASTRHRTDSGVGAHPDL
jgi:hypothetical protein